MQFDAGSIVYGGPPMRLFMSLTAAAAATVLVGAAVGAESDKFVIRGDAAKQLLEQNSINIATAEAIAKACVDEANKEGVKVSIAIYDQYGEPVYMYRMDGQAQVNIDTSFMKAKTRSDNHPSEIPALNHLARRGPLDQQ